MLRPGGIDVTNDDQPGAAQATLPEDSARAGLTPARAAAEVARQLAAPLDPGLYLVATPIGNLADITLRALAVLARADTIYCEDTRHSRTLLAHYAICAPLKPYHEHNAESVRPRVLAELAQKKRVALISDAGTPLVSDPGFKLVRAAVEQGHGVIAIPGPSAVLAALAAAGLPTDSFHFAGFLPPRSGARTARIGELKGIEGTLVLFEAPSRLAPCLADLAGVLGDRPAAVARELTKLHEEVRRGTLSSLAREHEGRDTKGEVVILVGAGAAGEVEDRAIEERLAVALAAMPLRDAARAVADALGVPKGRVYAIGLTLKGERR
jgi:16S rRNA (cytidine1402-2'-O)-methyltransferase